MSLEVFQFPCLSDNYGYLIRDSRTGEVACIDTPDVDAINAALASKNWPLNTILNTHHHYDHAGGNLALKEKWQCQIIGPREERDRIPGIDVAVGSGDQISIGDVKAAVYDTPGHTAGHIVYHFEQENMAFVGDTIFALGCGRLFEGTAAQMWASLSLIAKWPGHTKLYCAHEYTAANAKFALSVDAENQKLIERCAQIENLRAKGLPTVPSFVREELETNPFLRPADVNFQKQFGTRDPVEVFAKVRHLKDDF